MITRGKTLPSNFHRPQPPALWSRWHPGTAGCSGASQGKIKDVMISYSAAAQREYRECILLETNWTVNQRGDPTSDEQERGLVHRQGIGETGEHRHKTEPARADQERCKVICDKVRKKCEVSALITWENHTPSCCALHVPKAPKARFWPEERAVTCPLLYFVFWLWADVLHPVGLPRAGWQCWKLQPMWFLPDWEGSQGKQVVLFMLKMPGTPGSVPAPHLWNVGFKLSQGRQQFSGMFPFSFPMKLHTLSPISNKPYMFTAHAVSLQVSEAPGCAGEVAQGLPCSSGCPVLLQVPGAVGTEAQGGKPWADSPVIISGSLLLRRQTCSASKLPCTGWNPL